MPSQLTPLDYLRWLRAQLRGIPEEVAAYRVRREWCQRRVYIAPTAIIELGSHARLEIGKGSTIEDYTLLNLGDDPHAERIVPSCLKIGEHTSVGKFNNIRAGGGEVVIGSHCLISQFVTITCVNHSTARAAPMIDQPLDIRKNIVRIGDDVWIGANTVILPGVTIGTGSVIGAGAVVTKDIPEYAIALGIPAQVRGFR